MTHLRILSVVELPVRVSISTCIGCGSMREFPTCEGVCRERKLELVSGSDYDDLVTAAAVSRARIEALLPVVAQLAAVEAVPADRSGLYESVRERARSALQAPGLPVPELFADTASSDEPTVVWRCPDCGGLEATQPCIGVCIWRSLDWVELRAFESARIHLLRDIELDRTLSGLLTRFARVRPRDGEWEHNWHAFHAQARLLLSGR